MSSIERTAYPRFPRVITLKELQQSFTPTPEEVEWVTSNSRGQHPRVGLATMLKCFQHLHHFPAAPDVPSEIVEHISASLGLTPVQQLDYGGDLTHTMYRHHRKIRELLVIKPYDEKAGRALILKTARDAAELVNTRIDLINITINEMVRLGWELPVFRTLDDICEAIHAAAEADLHVAIAQKLSPDQRAWLDSLLLGELPARQTRYNQLKRSAKRSSRKHLDDLIDQLSWLESLPPCDAPLAGVAATKVKHMGEVAASLDAGDLKDFRPAKRHAYILALIHQMQLRARDDIAEMFIRRISVIHKVSREDLLDKQRHQRDLSEELVATLDDVLEILAENLEDAQTGAAVRELLTPNGNLDKLREDCAAIRVWSGGNHLPLVWKPFASHRAVMFRMAQSLKFEMPGKDKTLMAALAIVMANETRKAEWIDDEPDLAFVTDRRWHKLITRSTGHGKPTNRRYLEVCVFSVLATELRSGGVCVERSETFADYRKKLVPWKECKELLPAYCERVGIPSTAKGFVDSLKTMLRDTANTLDKDFPKHAGDVMLDSRGNISVKRTTAKEIPASAIALQAALESRIPARNILDILANIEHWTGFTRHFGPISGDEPKLRNARERYLLTTFAIGCNLGPNQAARHLSNGVTPHQLSYAYRHVADNYIAYFRHFIPPGMLEALYVIEGLLKTKLSVEPDTVYSDTHGQSETVFAYTYLSGITLMPRIRGWKDLHFYRPDRSTTYDHINGLFTGDVDWQLIEDRFNDLMQVAISMQQGVVASPLLLRKLSAEGRNNQLFKASRELGRVLRTAYLLRWVGSKDMRQEVTGVTNKIESYHAFTKWLDFGGDVINENDPVEQQKRLRFLDLVASAVILQNTVDMMRALQAMYHAGEPVEIGDMAFLSPYGRHFKRFGNYLLDMKKAPESWVKEALFRDAVKESRRRAPPDGAKGQPGKQS